MAISDTVQTLWAAFFLSVGREYSPVLCADWLYSGILLQAAIGALYIYQKGHGSTIFQDGRRLVLLLFLLFAALWAQMNWINLLLPTTSSTACQATLVFSTTFDQLARVGVEQFLLWSVGHGTKLTAERLTLQVVLFIRMVVGGVLVVFTRPDFAPVCVARTSVLPVSIVVLVLDVIIIGVLLIRAISLGMFGDLRRNSSSTRQEQSKALLLSIVGFTVWTSVGSKPPNVIVVADASCVQMSGPMLLGIPSVLLILRTVLPSTGVLILIGKT